MKKFYTLFTLLAVLLLPLSTLRAQGTENFEDETAGATTFTENSQGFTITNGPGETTYDIEFFTAGGWNGSAPDNQFIDNSAGSPTQNDGSSFTVTTTDGADISITSLFIFISTRALLNPTSSLTITGKKNGATEYTITKSTGFSNVETFSPNNGFTFIDFATEGAADYSTTKVDELIFSTTFNGDYIALDNFIYDFEILETDPPQVQSITVVGSPTSTATSVDFLVTFNEDALNVDTSDFVLDAVGTSGAISGISGSGTTYTVTVSSISGEGTISIDLGTNDITDTLTNGPAPAFMAGEAHTVSRCFQETFEGFITGDFMFSSNGVGFTTGTTNFNVENFVNGGAGSSDQFLSNDADTGTGKIYNITTPGTELFNVEALDVFLSSIPAATSPTNDGSIVLRGKLTGSTLYTITKNSGFPTDFSVNNGFTTIDFDTAGASDYSLTNIDELEIELGGAFVYIALDNFEHCEEVSTAAPPIVQSIKLVGNPPADAATIDFEVIFNEDAVNVSIDDFTLNQNGTAVGTIASISGSGNTYIVTVNTISGEGSVRLDLNPGTDIEDTLGNTPPDPFTMGEVHLVSDCKVETFESLADGTFSWTTDTHPFTTGSTNLSVDEFIGAGAGGSDRYLDNLTDQGVGKVYSIAISDNNLMFMNSMEFFVSSLLNGTMPTDDGTLTIVGKLDGIDQFTAVKSTGFPTAFGTTNGFFTWDFATEGGSDNSLVIVDELEITLGGSFQYMAIDNFKFCDVNDPPVAICQDIILSLDAVGTGVILPSQIDGGSTDDVGIPFLGFEVLNLDYETTASSPTDDYAFGVYFIDQSAFMVSTSGDYTFSSSNYVGSSTHVMILFDDTPVPNSGNLFSRPEFVGFITFDATGAVVATEGTTVLNVPTFTLQANKSYYMHNINDVPNEVAAGILSVDLPIISTAAQTKFNCADAGDISQTLYVFDSFGASDSCIATVTISDTTAPAVVCQDITVELDPTGNVNVLASAIDNGSSDNCGIARLGFEIPGIIPGLYALNPFASTNNIARYDYDSSTDDIAIIDNPYGSTTLSVNYAMDINPVDGKVYILGTSSVTGNRALFEYDLVNATLGAEIGDVVSAGGANNANAMAFGTDGTLYIAFGTGDVNTFDISTSTSTAFATGLVSGGAGMAYDRDNDQLIYASGNGSISVSSIDGAGTVTALFTVAPPTGCGTAQGLEYIGNGKLLAASTFGCSVIFSIDLNTQTATTLLNPDGFQNDIKSLLFIPPSPTKSTLSFACEDLGVNAVTLTVVDNNGNVSTCSANVTVSYTGVIPCIVTLSPQVLLQGPLLNPATPGLMNDILREDGYLPSTSPYTDALTVDPNVFNLGGLSGTGLPADDIVDWIWVELRDSVDNTNVIVGQSALLQRDGDIVDLDGTSVLSMSAAPTAYYVAVKHRNHIGAMSQSTFALTSSSATMVDFTDNGFSTFGTDAQVILGSGDTALWAGNVNGDTTIQYAGAGVLDTTDLFAFILNDISNFLNLPTWSVTGYTNNDVDMNGITQYTGAGVLDTPYILQNILSYPGNFLNLSTWQIQEQLPEN